MRNLLPALAILLFPLFGTTQIPMDSLFLRGDSAGTTLLPIPIEAFPDPPNGAALHFDRDLLRLHQNAPLADLLQEAPAVFVKSYGPSGSSTPAFRGTGASHTQLFWNGLPINSPMLGLTDLSLGNVGMFEDVSLVFGAASAAYGDGGLGGAILLDNSKPEEGLQVFAGQEVASFGNYRSNLGIAGGKGKWGTSTKVNYMQAENDFPFKNISRSEPFTDTLEHSSLQQLSLLQQVSFEPNDRDDFTARVWLNSMDRELPPTMLTNNLTESQSDRTARAMLEWKRWPHTYSGWRSELRAAYFYDRLRYRNELAGIDSDSQTAQGFLDAKAGRFWRNKLFQEAGIRLNRIRAISPGYDAPILQTNATAFTRLRYTSTNGFRTSLLIRQTVQASEWAIPAVVLDASYSWRRNRNKVYINGGRNFRFPGFNDLYWQPGGNPDLQAENAWTGEVGMKQELLPWEGKYGLRTHFSGYVSQVENMILWVPGTGNIWSAENVQSVFVRGLEASVKLDKRTGNWRWSGEGSYALTVSENRSGGIGQVEGRQLIYVPRHTGLIRLRLSRGNWSAIGSQQFTGLRYTTRDNSEELPAFSIGNLRLTRKFSFKSGVLEAYAGINNAWNSSYQTIPWRPMPGRNFLVGLNLEWRKQ